LLLLGKVEKIPEPVDNDGLNGAKPKEAPEGEAARKLLVEATVGCEAALTLEVGTRLKDVERLTTEEVDCRLPVGGHTLPLNAVRDDPETEVVMFGIGS